MRNENEGFGAQGLLIRLYFHTVLCVLGLGDIPVVTVISSGRNMGGGSLPMRPLKVSDVVQKYARIQYIYSQMCYIFYRAEPASHVRLCKLAKQERRYVEKSN